MYKLFAPFYMIQERISCPRSNNPVQVFRIRDILVRIWILGSVPLTNGSGCGSGSGYGSCSFRQWPWRCQQKIFKCLLKVNLHHSSNIKSHKEVTKQKKSRFILIFLTEGSGSGVGSWSGSVQINYESGCWSRRLKNIQILRIRIPMQIWIRNTVQYSCL